MTEKSKVASEQESSNKMVFEETIARTIKDVLEFPHPIHGEVFRGQADNKWGLETNFERAAQDFKRSEWKVLERRLIIEFQRRAHHYRTDLPREDKYLEWLALMQHHGSPTRLLDFTRSFYVALFFAIEGAISDSAVWAIRPEYIDAGGKESIIGVAYQDYSYFEEAEKRADEIIATSLTRSGSLGIVIAEPRRLNERLSLQQGLFLFPEDLSKTFEENLCAGHGAKSLRELSKRAVRGFSPRVARKIVIPKKLHGHIAYILSTMNITAATLFPGLDGFAKSQMMYLRSIKHCESDVAYSTFMSMAGRLAATMHSDGRTSEPGDDEQQE